MVNMMKKKKYIALLLSLVAACAIGSVISSVAWFAGNDTIKTFDELGGSVLQSYFHKGKGTEDDPFTITTPWHYENFIKLHYTVKNFDTSAYYFQFGDTRDMKQELTSPMFFATDEHGKVDTSKVSDVLNLGGMVLPPLGTESKPFIAHVNGNDLTVTNFKITGYDSNDKGYNDIGIFGFVGAKTMGDESTAASVSNCYWANFTIDTKGGSASDFPHSAGDIEHPDNIFMGYLGGHVVYASSFTDCYVNSCTISGGTDISKHLHTDSGINSYSYYGKVEYDYLGGKSGKGNDYEFSLNSQAVYNYFNTNYSNIQNNQLVIRNTSETETIAPDPETGDKIKDMTYPDGSVMPLSEAVTLVDRPVVSDTFLLNGNSPSSPTGNKNYSLSTTGFKTQKFIEEAYKYNVYYDGDPNTAEIEKTIPEKAPNYTDHSLKDANEGLIQDDDGSWVPTQYYYKKATPDGHGQWTYGESYNRKVTPLDMADFKINLSMDQFETPEAVIIPPYGIQTTCRLYVDDNADPINVKATATFTRGRRSGLTSYYYNCNVAFDSVTVKDLIYGEHYFSIYFSVYYNLTRYHRYVYGNLENVGGDTILRQIGHPVNDEASKSVNINFDTSKSINSDPDEYEKKAFTFDPDYPFIDKRSHENPMYFYQVVDGIEKTNYETDKTIIDQFNGLDINYNNRIWTVNKVVKILDPDPQNLPYFIGDRAELTESGYEYKNIDVVGGDVDASCIRTTHAKRRVAHACTCITGGEHRGGIGKQERNVLAVVDCLDLIF